MTNAIENLYRLDPKLERSYIEQVLRLTGPLAEQVSTMTGGITREEAVVLFDIVESLHPITTLEVGLGYAFSALVICEAAGRSASDRKHIVIDPNQTRYWKLQGLSHLKAAGHGDSIEFHEAPSFKVLPELVKAGQRIDFAFIDGWHTFDYVMVDFFFVDKMLRKGGVVAFDDADWPSIRPVIRYIITNLDYTVYRTMPENGSRAAIDVELGLEGSCIALKKNSEETTRDIFFHKSFG